MRTMNIVMNVEEGASVKLTDIIDIIEFYELLIYV